MLHLSAVIFEKIVKCLPTFRGYSEWSVWQSRSLPCNGQSWSLPCNGQIRHFYIYNRIEDSEFLG